MKITIFTLLVLCNFAFAFVLLQPLPVFAQPPATAPEMTSCVVTFSAPAGGNRANVTCSGAECAYKFITDYVRISSRYGPRGGGFHRGIDLAGPRGTPLHALEPGVVLRVGVFTGTGNAIELRDDNGRKHFYMHMVAPSPLSAGQRVNAGDVVGNMDSTGNSTGDHLHYQISQPNGDYANPDEILANWPNY